MAKKATGSSRQEGRSQRKKPATGEASDLRFLSPSARIDWNKFGRGPSAKDLEEIPELTGPFVRVGSVLNWGRKGPKAQVTIRLDQDVLKWLRSKGRGYQTKLNLLLRQHMLLDRARKKAS